MYETGENLIHMWQTIKRISVTSKTTLICILLVTLSLTVSGCILGYNTGTPTATVNSYFDAIQWLDLNGLNELLVPSERLDDEALDKLQDDTYEVTRWLREWQVVVTNRTISVLEENSTQATINVSVDIQVTAMVRGIREYNQTHIDSNFYLELIDSQWLVSEYSGPELLGAARL